MVLSPRAVSWLSELEYERIEALEEESQWEANKARQKEAWLSEEFIRSVFRLMFEFVVGRPVLQ